MKNIVILTISKYFPKTTKHVCGYKFTICGYNDIFNKNGSLVFVISESI